MDALVVAFGAGLAAAASPCLLPLYPAFLAYLTSTSGVEAGSSEARRVSGLLGLAVLLGLLTSMMLIGIVVFAIAVPMGRILAFAIPFIDLLLIALGVMLLAGTQSLHADADDPSAGRPRAAVTGVRLRHVPGPHRACPVPARSWWRSWLSR